MDHCSPVSDVVFRQCLRSASSHQLSVPRHRLSTKTVLLPDQLSETVWSLAIRNVLQMFLDNRRRRSCYPTSSVFSALEVIYDNALYKSTFDIWPTECGRKKWTPNFFSPFSQQPLDFNIKVYDFIYWNLLHLTAK